MRGLALALDHGHLVAGLGEIPGAGHADHAGAENDDFHSIMIAAMPLFSIGERRVELRGEHHYIAHDATLVGAITLENDVNVWFKVVIRADNDQITHRRRLQHPGRLGAARRPGLPA